MPLGRQLLIYINVEVSEIAHPCRRKTQLTVTDHALCRSAVLRRSRVLWKPSLTCRHYVPRLHSQVL